MSLTAHGLDHQILLLLMMVFFVCAIVTPVHGLNIDKKDENLVPGGDGSGVKCTACSSCENPCNQRPPPPPPSPPPPTPTTPSKNYCPPPPPPPYTYITGPPRDLYPYDPYYSSSAVPKVIQFAVVLGCGLLSLLVSLRF